MRFLDIQQINHLFFFRLNSLELIYIDVANLKFNYCRDVNTKILKIRKNLDKLDNKLLEIIKKRTKLVDEIVKNKKFKKDIIDRKRILIILKKIKKKSKDKNIDIKITRKIWSSMISAYIDYEYRTFKKSRKLLWM